MLFSSVGRTQMLDVYGGFNFGTFRNKSFNTFVDSYNSYNSSFGTVEKELKPFHTCRGLNFDVAVYPFNDMGIGFSYNIMRLRAHTSAELSTGTRHVEQLVRCPLNFGFPIKLGPIVIHPKMGVTNSDFLVYYEYKDGSMSYGGEKLLNGKYSGFGFIGELSLEIDVAPLDWPVAISVGGSWTGCKAISENTEWNWARSFTPTYYPSGLPLDYAQWQTTTAAINYTDYDAGYANGNFMSFYLFINLKLRLGNDFE